MTNTQKTWEERFDEKFGRLPNGDEFLVKDVKTGDNRCMACGHPANPNRALDNIKSFIHQELNNLAQQFLEAIPDKEISDINHGGGQYGHPETDFKEGYNKAIKEIEEKFNKIIKNL